MPPRTIIVWYVPFSLSNCILTVFVSHPPPCLSLACLLLVHLQEIRAVISTEDTTSAPDARNGVATNTAGQLEALYSELDAKLPQPPHYLTTSSSSSSHRLDAEALKVNEMIYRQQINMADGGLGTGHNHPPSPNKGGLLYANLSSRSRTASRSGSVKSRESRRRSQALERDETESVISSVSTHRSGRSANSTSWVKRKQKTQITAENLAILNRLNGDDEGNGAGGGGGGVDGGAGAPKVRAPDRGQPTPATSRKTKTTEEAPVASWWPKLF